MNHRCIALQIKVLRLRIEVQSLMIKCIKAYKSEEFYKCRDIDAALIIIIKSIKKFNFVFHSNEGLSLFIGEGNLSFACEIANKSQNPNYIIATTYESFDCYDNLSIQNKQRLEQMGATVLDGIDGEKINIGLQNLYMKFHLIVFQFPHTGKQDYHDGKTPNFDLVRNFLISSKRCLSQDGLIAITYVDNSYYNGVFQFAKLNRELGFRVMEKHIFDPKDFLNYKHKMTNGDESGILNHNQFATMVFSCREHRLT